MPLLLTESDVRAVLEMPRLIDEMARALAEYSSGAVAQPVRTVLEIGDDHNYFGVMPAAVRAPAAAGAKLVTVFHRNHARGLPSHLATIVLVDPETGALTALVDGRYITEARTAAVSAVSARLLARPDAGVLAMLGSGVQARSHLRAFRHVRPLREVRVWSPTRAHADRFAAEMSGETGVEIRVMPEPAAALADADLVVVATSSTTPVLRDADIAPGAHIAAVGACRPDQRELPTPLIARARVFVDSRAGALAEAGDLLLPIREGAIDATHVAGELGELVLGRVQGRVTDDEVTVFKSLGMAVEDVVAANWAVGEAEARGLGQRFHLQAGPAVARDHDA